MGNAVLTAVVLAAVAGLAALCVRSLINEHKKGELCACINDCSKFKIQCRSNPGYYGIRTPDAPRGSESKEAKP